MSLRVELEDYEKYYFNNDFKNIIDYLKDNIPPTSGYDSIFFKLILFALSFSSDIRKMSSRHIHYLLRNYMPGHVDAIYQGIKLSHYVELKDEYKIIKGD